MHRGVLGAHVESADAIAGLRVELKSILGNTESLLYRRCLANGTHSGDVVEYELLDQLDTEIARTLSKIGAQRLAWFALPRGSEILSFSYDVASLGRHGKELDLSASVSKDQPIIPTVTAKESPLRSCRG
jgi:hypothetical protein